MSSAVRLSQLLHMSPLKAFQLQILSHNVDNRWLTNACLPWYFHGLWFEFGAGPLDSESYHSPGQCFHPCGHFAVCKCSDVCPLSPCLWTSWAICLCYLSILCPEILSSTVLHYIPSTDMFYWNLMFVAENQVYKPCINIMTSGIT